MAPKKPSTRDKAQHFIDQFVTAGGPIGAPALVAFGTSDLFQQVRSGNVDEYAYIRGINSTPTVGKPNAPLPTLPQDLDSAYLKLNLPGSPLPRLGLLAPQFTDAAQYTQDNIVANEQYAMSKYMPQTGQLPLLPQPPAPRNKGSR